LEDEAIKACERYPDRLAYLLRIDPKDPEYDSRIAAVKQDPHGVAVRVIVHKPDEIEFLQQGGYTDIFASAARHDMPMCFWARGLSHLLSPYLEKLPELTLVVDHCGLSNRDELPGAFEPVLAMARYPNTYLKLSHAPERFSRKPYPFDDMAGYLEKALAAYGPERILWGSDHTVSRHHHSWAESLFCLRDSPRLSASDKEWILGRTAMTLFNWTPAPAPAPPSHT
jgi:L-fuconolactonase